MQTFTVDWFHRNARPDQIWRRTLGKLMGQPDLQILEIGSYEGMSAVHWLENYCTHETSRLTCVDPWRSYAALPSCDLEAAFHRFKENTAPFCDRLRVMRETSARAFASLLAADEKFDLIYVDGCHQAAIVLADARSSLELTKSGGIIVFDDCHQPV